MYFKYLMYIKRKELVHETRKNNLFKSGREKTQKIGVFYAIFVPFPANTCTICTKAWLVHVVHETILGCLAIKSIMSLSVC